MNTSIRTLTFAAAMMMAFAALTGCGKSNPVAPEVEVEPAPAPEQQKIRVTVFLYRVRCIDSGDLGEGEFRLKARGHVGTEDLYVSDAVDMSDGDTHYINKYKSWTLPAGSRVQVSFEATEWDKDLFSGEVYPDPDMDHRETSITLSDAEGELNTGSRTLTLGNDKCKVRLYYEVKAVKI